VYVAVVKCLPFVKMAACPHRRIVWTRPFKNDWVYHMAVLVCDAAVYARAARHFETKPPPPCLTYATDT
jgi:hypothetical protein